MITFNMINVCSCLFLVSILSYILLLIVMRFWLTKQREKQLTYLYYISVYWIIPTAIIMIISFFGVFFGLLANYLK